MSVTTRKKVTFDLEFRNRAIQMALSSTESIAYTAEKLGIKASTLYRWVTLHKKEFVSKNPNQGPDVYEELAQLRKEFARVQEERDILKKAAKYFAKESR